MNAINESNIKTSNELTPEKGGKNRKIAALITGIIGGGLYLMNGFLSIHAFSPPGVLSAPYWTVGAILLITSLIGVKFIKIAGIVNLLALPITVIIFIIMGQVPPEMIIIINFFMGVPILFAPLILVITSGILFLAGPKKMSEEHKRAKRKKFIPPKIGIIGAAAMLTAAIMAALRIDYMRVYFGNTVPILYTIILFSVGGLGLLGAILGFLEKRVAGRSILLVAGLISIIFLLIFLMYIYIFIAGGIIGYFFGGFLILGIFLMITGGILGLVHKNGSPS